MHFHDMPPHDLSGELLGSTRTQLLAAGMHIMQLGPAVMPAGVSWHCLTHV